MADWRRRHYSYARFALYDALCLAGVGSGDTVLLPAFICRDVLAPLNELGATASFYEVDRGLRPVVEDVPEASAVLAVNYFGFPQRLNELRDLAGRLGAAIIEDNAHGYLSRDDEGEELGRRTGIGFTSFRKTLRVVNGAFLDVDSDRFPGVLGLAETPATDDRLPAGFRARRTVAALERSTRVPFLNLSRAAVRSVRRLSGRPIIPVSLESETVMPARRPVHASSLAALDSLDRDRESRRRRSLYENVASRLRSSGRELIFEELGPNTVPWCVPFHSSPDELGIARRSLRGLGLEIFPWPDLPATVRERGPSWYGHVFVVSMLK